VTPLFSMSFLILSFQVMRGRPILHDPSVCLSVLDDDDDDDDDVTLWKSLLVKKPELVPIVVLRRKTL